MPLGFFLSVASPQSEKPNSLIYLVPIGGLWLSVGAVTPAVGLVSVEISGWRAGRDERAPVEQLAYPGNLRG